MLFAGVDLVATSAALVALVVLHVLPTGLSPVDHPVSQYAITPYRQGYRVLTVALGVAGLASAVVVAQTYPPSRRSTIVGLLVVFGVCRLLISWWPMDAPGEPRSRQGTIHLVLALGGFLGATLAAGRMQNALVGSSFGAGYNAALVTAFWLLVAGLVGSVAARRTEGHHYFGAAERVIYVGLFVMLGATGLVTI